MNLGKDGNTEYIRNKRLMALAVIGKDMRNRLFPDPYTLLSGA